MKALELTIYPKPRYALTTWQYQGDPSKRLSDAELAAEFHAARADYGEASRHPSQTYWTPLDVGEDATAGTALKRSVTMLRFATLPHYDEADQ